jgi:toxin ParE1/3/4
MGFRLNPYAERDLEDIFYYGFQTWGESRATLFLEMLYQKFQWLADNPEIAPIREDFTPAIYRSWFVEPYMIFYRIVEGKEIEIMAVLHGRKNFLIDELSKRDEE